MLELMKTRRSIRAFQDREVEQEKIDSILKSGLLAPSGRASRPWEFIVVTEKEKLHRLASCRERSSQFLAGAPVGIVVAADEKASTTWVEDASIAAAFMQLMVHSLGLGSCWIHVRERSYNDSKSSEEYVREILNIPEHVRVLCILAIGYPAEEKAAHMEDNLLYHKIHYNEY
ncbi:MAG TPA: NAD(P)H nitroreductase [Clostridiales bacterium]|nr:NAD(P)H nitroreductase [Clostridiales bacterium]